MNTRAQKGYVILSVLLCALAMSLVDGVIQPGYGVKSLIKIVLFLVVPMGYFLIFRQQAAQIKTLFVPARKDLIAALVLGAAVYGIILGSYYLLTTLADISYMVLELTAQAGVHAENFVFISLYISLVNSLLEEFFFRGFAFITLKKLTNRPIAYTFSAALFALYHFGMLAGSFHLWLWIAALLGLFIAGCVLNFLNEKSGNIITSWLVHMFANFAINTIGFMIFGIL